MERFTIYGPLNSMVGDIYVLWLIQMPDLGRL
ncbi:hypothetical protein PYK22_01900 [Pyrinomonas methylaliphatogenes]|uniref:Uncharacterized protein n=1 Tax=Pyrinomonas methylaliphatogenes TaxID=454194 RepID=A0A0B6WYT4_9BACT|nr:hypothetical protein PYK22_01900 [Pyrinomonas methylaliphatogenes]